MWTTLGNPGQAAVDLAVGTNADGHLELFVLTNTQQIWHNWQVSPGADWSGWNLFGTATDTGIALAVAQNADARLELFRVAPDGGVWHSGQVAPNADWSAWSPMTNPEGATALLVVRNADGRLEVFIASSAASGNVWHAWQTTPGNGWSQWSQLGNPLGSQVQPITGAQNADGRLEVFAMTSANGVWHIYQLTPGGDWSAWTLLTAADAASLDIALAQNVDGRLELLLISAANAVMHAWQVVPNGGWSDWSVLPNGGHTGTDVTVARNADGRLEAFLVDTANASWHNWQTAANAGWSGWQSLDGQPVSGALSVRQNVDGRLEPFAIGPGGDVWHTWQRSANQWTWPGADFATNPQLNPSQAANLFVTQHADSARTGWTPFESTLTVANVGTLRQLFTQVLDGTAYAQPLYVGGVAVAGQGTHNAVYVATENDTVSAFDADSGQAALWSRTLVPPGEAPVSTGDIEGCTNIAPVVGVTSTPVIADSTGTLYVLAKTKRLADGTFHQYLHALDITTGADQPNSPTEIWASCPGVSQANDGQGSTRLISQWQLNRPGLLLMGGVVYLAFGAHCDLHPGIYHGWVVGYDAVTLNQVTVWCASPNAVQADTAGVQTGGGGIWQSGVGLAADSSSNIYCATGNGPFDADAGGRNYGDSVVKLGRDLRVLDSFTPADEADLLANDLDLGSGGPCVIPSQSSGAGGPTELLVMCGKAGDIFLLNRQSLGGYTGPSGNNAQAVQVLPLQPGLARDTEPGVFGGAAYFQDSGPAGATQLVYYCGGGGPLSAFVLDNGTLSPSSQTAEVFASGTPTVSSNGTTAGTGIVWMIARQNPLRLLAFDATDLTHKLVDLEAGPWNNGGGGPFLEPTVINGKAYVASDGQLTVFGL